MGGNAPIQEPRGMSFRLKANWGQWATFYSSRFLYSLLFGVSVIALLIIIVPHQIWIQPWLKAKFDRDMAAVIFTLSIALLLGRGLRAGRLDAIPVGFVGAAILSFVSGLTENLAAAIWYRQLYLLLLSVIMVGQYLPKQSSRSQGRLYILAPVLSLGIVLAISPGSLPSSLLGTNELSGVVKVLSLLTGILFFLAAFLNLTAKVSSSRVRSLPLLCASLVLGLSALASPFCEIWTIRWWVADIIVPTASIFALLLMYWEDAKTQIREINRLRISIAMRIASFWPVHE